MPMNKNVEAGASEAFDNLCNTWTLFRAKELLCRLFVRLVLSKRRFENCTIEIYLSICVCIDVIMFAI